MKCMEYSYVHGIKTEPQQGLVGICPRCGKEVFAKCGKIKLHHWAHKNLKDCDAWAEPETQWHRYWKNKFLKEYQEVVFTNPITNEKHRADVHTAKGITIEFQNSPISLDELHSRDEFYNNLIWIVNGEKFKGEFNMTCSIPNPQSPLLDNFSICSIGKYSMNVKENLMFFRNPIDENDFEANRLLNINDPLLNEISLMMNKSQSKYWMIDWKHKHNAWYNSKSHVFFDFGDDFLYWLKSRKQYRNPTILWYVHIIEKKEFIKKYNL